MDAQPPTKTGSQIIQTLRAIHIETDRDRALTSQLRRLLQVDIEGNLLPLPVRFTAGLETRGIALIEPAGGGKTTAVREVLLGFETLAHHPDTGAPRFLHIEVQSPATQKSLGIAILKELGIDAVSDRVKVWEIWDMVRVRLMIAGKIVLWIDEAHDLFLSRSAREIDDMLKMLKSMMQGDSAVIVILSGTERLMEITSYDPQVNRRFTKIRPRDLAIGADEADLEALIHVYCKRACLGFDATGNIASRLIYASRHRFGRAVETIINAIEVALADRDSGLGILHFAESWGMQEGCAWSDNVFVATSWRAIELDGQAAEFDAARSERQKKLRSRS
jgi:hypothetical protein